MRNILLELEYDGTEFSGWQYQPGKRTVQAEIENALNKIFNNQLKGHIIGASRTDAGVSAEGQIANFYCSSKISTERLQRSLNSILPDDIYVKQVLEVPKDFNARYDSKSKIYEYRILLGNSPLRRRFVWEFGYRLNIKAMRRASKLFLGKNDYSKFCESKEPDRIVNVKYIKLQKRGDELVFNIKANRFLFKMVRRIVGALVDFGRGMITEADIKNALLGKPHKPFITAPAQGLILKKVSF